MKIKMKFFSPTADISHVPCFLPLPAVTFSAKQCSKRKIYEITYLDSLTSFCHGNEVIYMEKCITSAFRQNEFIMIDGFTATMREAGNG